MSECQTICIRSEGDVCFTVVDTVARLTATDPLELEPLGTVVDTDAVETLFGAAGRGGVRHDVDLSFRYEGCDVTVESDGTVSVTPAEATTFSAFPAPSAANAGPVWGDRSDVDAR